MARKNNALIDFKKLKMVCIRREKYVSALSEEMGYSKDWLRKTAGSGEIDMAAFKLLCLMLQCNESELMPDPEPVKEEPKITEYPIMPTITAQEFESLKLQLNRIERLQAEIVNAINAIGGADEVVERMLQKVKPVDEVNCENMLSRMFNTCNSEMVEYGAFYNNCKSKWDVSLKTINNAIANMGCEIVANPNGKGRVIRKEAKAND